MNVSAHVSGRCHEKKVYTYYILNVKHTDVFTPKVLAALIFPH